MRIDDCKIITLPKISDPRGNLTFVEGGNHIPFDIKRVYYLYDVPAGSDRGSHAHINLHQVMIAISGSFDVTLDDGTKKNKFTLNKPFNGLYIPPLMWRYLDNFSSGSVCVVFASDFYKTEDYIHNYSEFLSVVRGKL